MSLTEVESLRQAVAARPNDVEAHLQLVIALFEEDLYEECRQVAEKALKIEGISEQRAKKIGLWLRKCNTHLGAAAPAEAAPQAPAPTAAPQPTPTVQAAQCAPQSQNAQPAPAQSAQPVQTAAPPQRVPMVRNDWFQTPSSIEFSFYARDRSAEDVRVTAEERSLEVCIRLGEGKEFQHAFENFFAAIDKANVSVSVRPAKVTVTVKKVAAAQWPMLELPPDSAPVASAPAPTAAAAQPLPPTAPLVYPNSKKRDWSNFKVEEEKETPGQLSGDHQLTKTFKDLYAIADDDCRRAMMKSYTESGGTVFSTNWKDVGSRTLKCEAPNGLEVRHWNDDTA